MSTWPEHVACNNMLNSMYRGMNSTFKVHLLMHTFKVHTADVLATLRRTPSIAG
jgi:hypothetical protein